MPSSRAPRLRNTASNSSAAAPRSPFESGVKEHIVISEFPSLEQAIAAHNGPEYQEALKALGDGAVRDIRLIEGLEVAHPHPPLSRSANSTRALR